MILLVLLSRCKRSRQQRQRNNTGRAFLLLPLILAGGGNSPVQKAQLDVLLLSSYLRLLERRGH